MLVMLGTAVPAFAPVVQAHSLRAQTDAYPCEDQQFVEHTGSFQWFNHTGVQYKLSASLWADMDPTRTNVYCGSVQTEGKDQLTNGCITFQGQTNEQPSGSVVSTYSVFHCTATTYTFWGAVTAISCGSGSGLVAGAFVQQYPTDDILSQIYYC
jgi:hypothetical protein